MPQYLLAAGERQGVGRKMRGTAHGFGLPSVTVGVPGGFGVQKVLLGRAQLRARYGTEFVGRIAAGASTGSGPPPDAP
ncbi:hypothetical protein ADL25_05340 [Streptomyces sp. NRRL F-5122]|nr:hypothetical protein ADL25_05340 [Streptomyces sp. NRRL F-5122]